MNSVELFHFNCIVLEVTFFVSVKTFDANIAIIGNSVLNAKNSHSEIEG